MAVDTDELPDGLVGDLHSALMGACGWDDSDSYSRDVVGDMIDAVAPLIVRELRAAADEIDRLRRWKAEATEVLTEWDAVHQALGSPGRPGQSKAAASKAEVMRLSDEIDRLRSQNNRMCHLLAGDVSWLTGSVSFSPASDAARDKADRVLEAIRDLFAEDGE